MDSLLNITEYDPSEDRLIIAGDIIDRGKESYRVCSRVQKLMQRKTNPAVLIRGNHEQMMIDVLASPFAVLGKKYSRNLLWMQNGGDRTMESFREVRKKPEEMARFIKKNAVISYETDQFIVVHADPSSLKDPGRCVWGKDIARHNDYAGKLAVIGHTPMRNPVYLDGSGSRDGIVLPYDEWIDLPETGAIDIDTGGVFGGSFTAMIAEEKRFILKRI